ncbi:Ferrous-iron efflux pump FieF [Rubripirellula lacrimiformis]|uniref:Ferrous-iron efflux pump FieF n=1 Tax=Rubripirellula lacrimiformis TaxID=1930273 RepID=A0A517N694_9BACT|nr:cation diffusion facilitator family transporter [Rubripirellula lacrimiformis]QDT02653.1 Ferrous-iron efflux pump FieF [Rubripirellula lacrimiformis]
MSIQSPRDEASIRVRQRVYVDAGRAAVWGLGVNMVLVVLKLAGGIVLGSAALIADSVNSIGDVASAIAVRGALSVAQREEDDDHPYGHTKAESIAGLCVALLVTFSAGLLGLETLKRFGGELRVPSAAAGVIAAICALVKEVIYRYTQRVAKRLDSSALRAAAWDHRSDAWASAAVAVSLFSAPYVGTAAPYVDPIAAVCVCVLLVVTGIRIFSSTARELMDQQAGDEIVDRVREIGGRVDGVQDVEKLRVRKSGLEYFIEIHVQVEGHITVAEGHRIGHDVKDHLLIEMPRVRDVHVHIEPYDPRRG